MTIGKTASRNSPNTTPKAEVGQSKPAESSKPQEGVKDAANPWQGATGGKARDANASDFSPASAASSSSGSPNTPEGVLARYNDLSERLKKVGGDETRAGLIHLELSRLFMQCANQPHLGKLLPPEALKSTKVEVSKPVHTAESTLAEYQRIEKGLAEFGGPNGDPELTALLKTDRARLMYRVSRDPMLGVLLPKQD